jgi:hypothetical protein
LTVDPAIGIDDDYYVGTRASQMFARGCKGKSLAAPIGLVADDHRGAAQSGDFPCPVETIVGYDENGDGARSLLPKRRNRLSNDSLLVVGWNNDGGLGPGRLAWRTDSIGAQSRKDLNREKCGDCHDGQQKQERRGEDDRHGVL